MISPVLCPCSFSWVILQLPLLPFCLFVFSDHSQVILFPLVFCCCLFLPFLFYSSALPFWAALVFSFFTSLCPFVFAFCLSIGSFLTRLTSCCLQANLHPTHHLVSLFYLSSFSSPPPPNLLSTIKVTHGLRGKHLAHAGSHSLSFVLNALLL